MVQIRRHLTKFRALLFVGYVISLHFQMQLFIWIHASCFTLHLPYKWNKITSTFFLKRRWRISQAIMFIYFIYFFCLYPWLEVWSINDIYPCHLPFAYFFSILNCLSPTSTLILMHFNLLNSLNESNPKWLRV